MADIAPIRGILYDPKKVEASSVIAPPYDVISEGDREALEARHPANCVRLILPRGEGDAKYEEARHLLDEWQKSGILRRDQDPAFYRYHQVFKSSELGMSPVTRRGFIAAVMLCAYEEDVILPHERTHRGPKEDRLKLMTATNAHFSQIFGLYSDPGRESDRVFLETEAQSPYLEGTTADGTIHRLWRVTDRDIQTRVAKILATRKLYIADGHHRYETMLALRDQTRAQTKLAPRAAPQFATMFLTNMDDPGLVVLPTHRLVHALTDFDWEACVRRIGENFAIERVSGLAASADSLRQALAERSASGPTFATVVPGSMDAWLMSYKGKLGASVRARLDVTLLHEHVLEKVLAIRELLAHIWYVKDTSEALARVRTGEAQLGFLMHPTRVEQVRQVADAHEVMPEKSTFFYPKIASGLVINPLRSDEELAQLF